MSPVDPPVRPSLPHAAHRVRTDRARTLPPEEAETVRETTDPGFGEMVAVLRDPAGVTVESLLKLLQIAQRHATVSTRQADKLGVDLGVGQLSEKLDSMIDSRSFRQKLRSRFLVGATAAGWCLATVLGIWTWARSEAHDSAAATIVAPAVAAEAKVLTLEERIAQTERRHDETEATMTELRASIERLNGAVVALASKLEEPTRVEVPRR